MMGYLNPLLSKRAEHLTEMMDSPDCNKQDLFNTYRQFTHVNGLISRWSSLFDAYIAPMALQQTQSGKTLRVLDIGCGGGDICLKFSAWSLSRQLSLEITGIDPDPRAIEYTEQLHPPENVTFRQADSRELVEAGETYDIVVTNHLLHHLQNEDILQLCQDARNLASRLILFNDIRRSHIGFASFGLIAPVMYRSSFIYRDGLTSIRRSFNYQELKKLAPDEWQVKKLFPFRLLLIHEAAT